MQNVTESLAGRVAVMRLQGLSAGEAIGHGAQVIPFLPGNTPNNFHTQNDKAASLSWVYEHIWRGAFPALYAPGDAQADRDLFYSSYLQTYLQRDVRDLGQVGDLMIFTRFLRSAAARTGQLLNRHNGKQAPFYYYRDKDQKEIDVLIVRDGLIHPIEIKKTAQPGRDTVRHFSVLENMGLKIGNGTVTCLTREIIPVTALVAAIPAWQIA